MCSAPQSGFSRLNLRISACVFRETVGLPGRDFQRHYSLNPALCHLTTVAGCMTWASVLQSGSHFESTIQRRRNESVNLGFGAFFCSMASVQVTSWLWSAMTLATSTALGSNINQRKRRSRPSTPKMVEMTLRIVPQTCIFLLMPHSMARNGPRRKSLWRNTDGVFRGDSSSFLPQHKQRSGP